MQRKSSTHFDTGFFAVLYDFKTPMYFLPSQINQKNPSELTLKTQFYNRILFIPLQCHGSKIGVMYVTDVAHE